MFAFFGWYFDPMYFLFLAPAMLLAMYAQFRVKSTYAEASEVPNSRRLSGAEAAREILDSNGLTDVAIEPVEGTLSDHYDPKAAVLRLSPDVYDGRSLAAVGIAAHEAGHALQHAKGYAPLKLRTGLVPLASVGSSISMFLIMFGLLLSAGSRAAGPSLGMSLLYAGIIAFSLTVAFQLVNLPVEFDASRRARAVLAEQGIVARDEMAPVSRVLNAAALT